MLSNEEDASLDTAFLSTKLLGAAFQESLPMRDPVLTQLRFAGHFLDLWVHGSDKCSSDRRADGLSAHFSDATAAQAYPARETRLPFCCTGRVGSCFEGTSYYHCIL